MLQSVAAQFNAGGPFMWVLLAVPAIAGTVVLERVVFYFLVCRTDARRTAEKVLGALAEGGKAKAQGLLVGRTPLIRMLRAAIDHYDGGGDPEQAQRAVEHAAIREVPRLSRRLNYLDLFANVATLLGLLGTIAGLQVSFGSLASADAAQKASLLADGIAQAMNTTAFGLIIAVPCMIAYTLLNNKQQALVRDIDDAVVTVLNSLRSGSIR